MGNLNSGSLHDPNAGPPSLGSSAPPPPSPSSLFSLGSSSYKKKTTEKQKERVRGHSFLGTPVFAAMMKSGNLGWNVKRAEISIIQNSKGVDSVPMAHITGLRQVCLVAHCSPCYISPYPFSQNPGPMHNNSLRT